MESCKPVTELHIKKRGRPELTEQLKPYFLAVRKAGGVINNSSIVVVAGTGMPRQNDPGFVKRKATTKAKTTVQSFDEIKDSVFARYSSTGNIYEEILDGLIINWNQTAINYVPISQ